MKRTSIKAAKPTLLFLALACAGVAQAGTPISGNAQANGDARVSIENVRGAINVTGWDRDQVAVTGTLGEGSKFSITGSGPSVTVRVENEHEGSWSFFGGNGPKEDSVLNVSVPRGSALDVEAVSADVEVKGITGSREIELESVSGDVRAEARADRAELGSVSGDVTFAGETRDVVLETVSGDIDARRADGRIKSESVSGNITLEAGMLDELTAGTVSGDVEIVATGIGSGRIAVESMSGDVYLGVPAALSARIEAETFSGSIDSDFGKVVDEDGPGTTLDVTVGKGDAEITLESFSGDVKVRRR